MCWNTRFKLQNIQNDGGVLKGLILKCTQEINAKQKNAEILQNMSNVELMIRRL